MRACGATAPPPKCALAGFLAASLICGAMALSPNCAFAGLLAASLICGEMSFAELRFLRLSPSQV